MGSVCLKIAWWGNDTPVNQTLYYISEVKTLINGEDDIFMEITMGIWFEIFGKRVW